MSRPEGQSLPDDEAEAAHDGEPDELPNPPVMKGLSAGVGQSLVAAMGATAAAQNEALRGVRVNLPTSVAALGLKYTATDSVMKGLSAGAGQSLVAAMGASVMAAQNEALRGLRVNLPTSVAALGLKYTATDSVMKGWSAGVGQSLVAAMGASVMAAQNEALRGLRVNFPTSAAGIKSVMIGSQLGSAFGTQGLGAAYAGALRELFSDLDLPTFDASTVGFDVEPTRDSSAYLAILEVSPETAAAIDDAAALIRTPFWSREVVRNTLAWFLATVVGLAYVGGTVLFPPWGPLVVALLSAGGVTVPETYRSIAAPKQKD